MKEPSRRYSVLEFALKPSQVLTMVHSISQDSSNVSFGNHALDRMDERGITTLDTLRVLRQGELRGKVEAGLNKGEWKCKVVKKMKGMREIGVVTIVMSAGRLFIKTVEWEDL
jgi:hypothetical protein